MFFLQREADFFGMEVFQYLIQETLVDLEKEHRASTIDIADIRNSVNQIANNTYYTGGRNWNTLPSFLTLFANYDEMWEHKFKRTFIFSSFVIKVKQTTQCGGSNEHYRFGNFELLKFREMSRI